MNRLPSTADCEEEAGVSSPNSTLSSVSGKRSEREAHCEELDIERACSRGISDEEDGETSRKKLRLSKDQSAVLEESFKEHNTLNPVSILCTKTQLNHYQVCLVAEGKKKVQSKANKFWPFSFLIPKRIFTLHRLDGGSSVNSLLPIFSRKKKNI